MLDGALGPHSGKGTSELGLLRSLGAVFSPGDVMLADAYYCNYFLIATLRQLSVDVLFEQKGARSTDFHCGKALDRRDHLVRWPKPSTPPKWMTREQYQAFSDELTMREASASPDR